MPSTSLSTAEVLVVDGFTMLTVDSAAFDHVCPEGSAPEAQLMQKPMSPVLLADGRNLTSKGFNIVWADCRVAGLLS